MYILLCGYPPFGGKTDAKILARVQAGQYSFEGKEWEVVTEAAKDMVARMLVMDISKRATAKELLAHRWFQVAATAPAAALGAHMVKRLRAFAGMSRMKRLALVVLARTLTDNDVKRLRVGQSVAEGGLTPASRRARGREERGVGTGGGVGADCAPAAQDGGAGVHRGRPRPTPLAPRLPLHGTCSHAWGQGQRLMRACCCVFSFFLGGGGGACFMPCACQAGAHAAHVCKRRVPRVAWCELLAAWLACRLVAHSSGWPAALLLLLLHAHVAQMHRIIKHGQRCVPAGVWPCLPGRGPTLKSHPARLLMHLGGQTRPHAVAAVPGPSF